MKMNSQKEPNFTLQRMQSERMAFGDELFL